MLALAWRRPRYVEGRPQSAYPGSVRVWLAAYVAVMLVGAAVYGETWLSRADPFEV